MKMEYIPWNKGEIRVCSEETKNKMSVAHKGKKLSKESIQKREKTKKEKRVRGLIKTIISEEQRKKISETLKRKYASGEIINPNKGKKLSLEIRNKISKTEKERYASGEIISVRKGKKLSKEQCERHSKILKEKYKNGELIPPMLGKHHSPEVCEKIRMGHLGQIPSWKGKKRSREHCEKLSKILKGRSVWNKGKKWSLEAKVKMRKSRIKYIEKCIGHQISPTYNKRACVFFNEINKKYNLNGLHAENKSEHSVLGYYIDYYEPNLNFVIEWNEEQHYKNNNELKGRDVIRNQQIKDFLKCDFIIIRQKYFEESKEFIFKQIEDIINKNNKFLKEEKINFLNN